LPVGALARDQAEGQKPRQAAESRLRQFIVFRRLLPRLRHSATASAGAEWAMDAMCRQSPIGSVSLTFPLGQCIIGLHRGIIT
jgi:hypothetical protein